MPQDPDAIQRQIEDTRVELAETIDAIADIVSPRRAVERANEQIKVKVAEFREELREKLLPRPPTGRVVGEREPGGAVAALNGARAETGVETGTVEVYREVHWGRVVLASGTLLALAVRAGRRRRQRQRQLRLGSAPHR